MTSSKCVIMALLVACWAQDYSGDDDYTTPSDDIGYIYDYDRGAATTTDDNFVVMLIRAGGDGSAARVDNCTCEGWMYDASCEYWRAATDEGACVCDEFDVAAVVDVAMLTICCGDGDDGGAIAMRALNHSRVTEARVWECNATGDDFAAVYGMRRFETDRDFVQLSSQRPDATNGSYVTFVRASALAAAAVKAASFVACARDAALSDEMRRVVRRAGDLLRDDDEFLATLIYTND